MLDAVEEPNTSKLQTLPSGSLYWEEREGNPQMSTMQEKKTHTHTKRSLVIDDSKVLSMSFKAEVRQWTGPRRMDRREHAEWSFQTQGITWVKRDWHLLKCRVCNLSCLVLHLGPLTLYMTGNKHFIHAHWKLNEKETKFRAWMSLVSMTTQ